MTKETLDKALILVNQIHDMEAIMNAFEEKRKVTLSAKADPMLTSRGDAELRLKDKELRKDVLDVLRKHLDRFKKEFEDL